MAKQKVWGSPTMTVSAPGTITLQATANGSQLALVPQGAQVEIQAGSGPDSATQVLGFRIPVHAVGKKNLVGFVQDLTLGISKSNGARVVVIADLAGSTKIFEFGYANSTATPLEEPLHIERIFSLQGLESSGLGVLGVGKPIPDYEATLVIMVQRRSQDEHASVTIDSLDVVAHFG